MEFFDQVHAFPLPAINSLSIIDGSMACMVPAKRSKTVEKTLSAMQFKKTFRKDPSFLVFIEELMMKKLSKKLPPRREVDHEIELEQSVKPQTLAAYRMK
ncbi:hypothetical protein AB3S75_019542 [Citrus x aurantiifolia]